jgi:hypothetical protein
MKRTLAKSDIEINVEVASDNGRERIALPGVGFVPRPAAPERKTIIWRDES